MVRMFSNTGTQPSVALNKLKNRRRKHYNAMLLSCKAQAAQLTEVQSTYWSCNQRKSGSKNGTHLQKYPNAAKCSLK